MAENAFEKNARDYREKLNTPAIARLMRLRTSCPIAQGWFQAWENGY